MTGIHRNQMAKENPPEVSPGVLATLCTWQSLKSLKLEMLSDKNIVSRKRHTRDLSQETHKISDSSLAQQFLSRPPQQWGTLAPV